MQHPDARDREADDGQDQELAITLEILQSVMERVSVAGGLPGTGYDFDTSFFDIGMDSLQIAEFIVELEDVLGKQLELGEIDQLDTLGDLCRSLRIAEDF
jgi:acyl carrier protein